MADEEEVVETGEVELEAEARDTGWTPQEEFKGDPSKWVDAQTWLERGKTILPFMKKDKEHLSAELARTREEVNYTKQQLQAMKQAMEDFKKFHQEETDRRVKEAVAELKAKKVAAYQEGDFETVAELDEQLAEVGKQKIQEQPKAQEQQPLDPAYVEWSTTPKGQEITGTPEKLAYASGIIQYLFNTTNLRGRALLDAVAEEVDNRFVAKQPASKVASGTTATSPVRESKANYSYKDLNEQQKAVCDSYTNTLVGPNKAYKSVEEWRSYYATTLLGAKK